jgi:hypothetical protein
MSVEASIRLEAHCRQPDILSPNDLCARGEVTQQTVRQYSDDTESSYCSTHRGDDFHGRRDYRLWFG